MMASVAPALAVILWLRGQAFRWVYPCSCLFAILSAHVHVQLQPISAGVVMLLMNNGHFPRS